MLLRGKKEKRKKTERNECLGRMPQIGLRTLKKVAIVLQLSPSWQMDNMQCTTTSLQ